MRSCLGEREGEGSPCEEAMQCTVHPSLVSSINSFCSVSVLLQVDIERDVLATLSRTRQCAEDLLATQHSPPGEAVKEYSAELVQVCVVCVCVRIFCNVCTGGQQYNGLVYCSLRV